MDIPGKVYKKKIRNHIPKFKFRQNNGGQRKNFKNL